MRRREFIAFAGTALVAAPSIVRAQDKVYRVGSLSPLGMLLAQSFTAIGYRVGGNLLIDTRSAGGRTEGLERAVRELVDAKVDVIVTTGYPATLAAKNSGLPTVVTHGAGDPVATGLVASLARPGGTVTGISDDAAELSSKRLQILKEAAPNIRRIAMLWNRNDRAMTMRYEASANVADAFGVSVQSLGVAEPDDFAEAFSAMSRDKPDAILMVSDNLTILNRKRVFDFATERRVPAMYEYENLSRDGGLMSYGSDFIECFRRAAVLTDRILKGANPADLPFEKPTQYRFVVNLKAAKAIGYEFPPSLLARADEVIE